MSKPFTGTVNVDIRDSEPDWSPFEPPRAPDGSPNVVYIVLDDVGFSAMSCYGGPIETPNIDKIAGDGVRYTQWHTTALCSPTRSCLLTGRNHTRNSMACITEAAVGFPAASGTIPPENGMLSEILGELGWNTYMVGKWHLCPEDEMNLASTRRNWPSGRGFERWYGFLGAETSQWYPDLVYDNHLVEQPRSPEEGYHLTDDITDKAMAFIQDAKAVAPGEAVLLVLRAGRVPRAASRAARVGRPVQGPLRHGLRGDARANPRPPKGDGHRPAGHRAAAGQPDRHARDAHRARREAVPGHGRDSPRGIRSRREEQRLFARMAEVYAGFLSHADYHIGRLLDFLEMIGERENTLVIVVSDNGASGEGGPNGSVNEMKFINGLPDDIEPNLAMVDELGGPKTYNHYPNGWAMAFNTPFKMWKRYEFNGGTSRPVHHLVAERNEGARRDPPSVPPRDRSRSHRARRARRRAAPNDQGPRAEQLRRRQHALQLRRRRRADDPPHAVLFDARLPRDLARRLEGDHHPSDRQRLEQLQRRRVGAVPRRRRPLGAAQPRGRAPGEGS